MALTRIKGTGITNLAVDTAQLAADAVTSAKIEDLAVDTEHLAASAVETAKINNDAVTGDKIENSPTIASNLTVTGDLSVTGSLPTAAKGWVKLQEVNANTTTVVVGSTSLFSTTYDMYMITASNIHTDDDAPDIKVRFILAEAVVDGSHYRSIANRLYSSSTVLVNDNDDDDKAYVAQGVGNATGESSDFQMFIHSPDGTSNHKSFYSIGVSSADNGQTYMNLNAGKYHSAEGSTLDGMHFFLSSGDFASGTFTLYGLTK